MNIQTAQTGRGDKPKPQAEVIADLIRQLQKDKFFGQMTVTFQSGKAHTVKVDRTYKIEQLQ